MDSFATSVSIMLQYGVPLKVLINKFTHARFEPSGFTSNPDIPIAKSVMDYIFRWMDLKFGEHAGDDDGTEATIPVEARVGGEAVKAMAAASGGPSRITMQPRPTIQAQTDSPPCPTCDSLTVRSGSCYKCVNCGSTTGCS
jgi:ribonucleoside-diphosphate reductase alpha chain